MGAPFKKVKIRTNGRKTKSAPDGLAVRGGPYRPEAGNYSSSASFMLW